jgi:hypothetical protein
VFEGITLEANTTYIAWVQALYSDSDSDWYSQTEQLIEDDGSNTIVTTVDMSKKLIEEFSNDNKLTLAESNSLKINLDRLREEKNTLVAATEILESNNSITITEKETYITKFNSLETYLKGYIIDSNNSLTDSDFPLDLSETTFRTTSKTKFEELENAKVSLSN